MAGDEQRRPGDLELAREIGRAKWERLVDIENFRFDRARSAGANLPIRLLHEIVDDLQGRPPSRATQRSEMPLQHDIAAYFVAALESVFRLTDFLADIRFEGLPAFRGAENAFVEAPLLDVLNPSARRGFGHDTSRELPRLAPASDYVAIWARDLGIDRGLIAILPQKDALTGFLTLFADSVRAVLRLSPRASSSYVTFTLNANPGYNVDYYPQYKYSPVAFGSTLTTPVVGQLLTGHYHFQGWLGGILTQDPRAHFAGPSSTSTRVSF